MIHQSSSGTSRLAALSACAVFCTTLLAAGGPAYAADKGSWDTTRGPAIDSEAYHYRPLVAPSRWDGFYFGLSYGYANGWTDVTAAAGTFDLDPTGGLGMLYGGYNWQLGSAVIGIEADIGTGSFEDSRGGISTDVYAVGSLRGRLGYLISPDFLIYATAGWAWGDYELAVAGRGTSETFSGYQVGAGTELKFADPWTLRLEYSYTDFGSETISLGGLTNRFEPGYHAVRAGVSFQF